MLVSLRCLKRGASKGFWSSASFVFNLRILQLPELLLHTRITQNYLVIIGLVWFGLRLIIDCIEVDLASGACLMRAFQCDSFQDFI